MSMRSSRYSSRNQLFALAFFAVSIGGLVSTTSCTHTVKPTPVKIKDSLRHYYPVIQKDELSMSFELTNVGDEVLVITDILPACSAVKLDQEMPDIIPPGKTERLKFKYYSEMNLGYVSHVIRFYGNIAPEGVAEVEFDVHVVRPTLDRSDYEEIFFDKQSAIKDLVDGDQGEKGYWVGNGCSPEDYSRYYNPSYQ